MSDGDPPDEDERPDEEPPSDPFDRLGPDTDREGDPFERFDDGQSVESDRHAPSEDDVWAPPGSDRRDDGPGDDGSGDGWTETGPIDQSSRSPNASGAETGAGDPFEHVETPSESPFDGDGSVFERVDTGGADPDRVWESITDGEDGDDTDGADPAVPEDGRYTDVSKHRFCERCEHFSPPPEVSCGHHAAEIIEFLDAETVRLLDCPVVAERDALERRD